MDPNNPYNIGMGIAIAIGIDIAYYCNREKLTKLIEYHERVGGN